MRKSAIILGLVAALTVSAVIAATLAVSWTNPIANTDGSMLAVTDIKQTRIEYGTCSGTAFGTKAGEVVVSGAATTGSLPNLTPGTWCARAYTQNIYGVESGPSNVASKVVAAPTPNPPTNFSLN